MKRQGVTESPDGRWTRPEDYIEALARKRTHRRAKDRRRERTEPEAPRMMLSTVPFLAVLALLGVLAVAIMVLAFPGNQAQHAPRQVAEKERGVAAKGWLQEAQKQFHR